LLRAQNSLHLVAACPFDQPEDDLNMKIINDIVETLWQAKTHRQVMFASHNANLVVNGDAEFIICCDYRTTATKLGGQIKCMGAIDVPEINREIAEVMEGGIRRSAVGGGTRWPTDCR
jgi:type III restriction enzyme